VLGDEAALLDTLFAITQAAGEQALPYFKKGSQTDAKIDLKEGGSPVTQADLLVDGFLRQHLVAALPQAGWLSEESLDHPERLTRRFTFIVDPIDGTKAFIKGDPRWAVSVALVDEGRPHLAVLHLPALGQTFTARRGFGAQLHTPAQSPSGVRVSTQAKLPGSKIAGPKRLLEQLSQNGLDFAAAPSVPSLAYRLALVANGALDLALASQNAHDWDIAASHLILSEAGGRLVGPEGYEPVYNTEIPRHGILMAAPNDLVDPLRQLLLQSSKNGK
jgi:myo-inositol-1(or 4)-monophosphatase